MYLSLEPYLLKQFCVVLINLGDWQVFMCSAVSEEEVIVFLMTFKSWKLVDW